MGLEIVEIVMGWEKSFGVALDDSVLASLLTPRRATEAIAAQLGAATDAGRACPTLLAFLAVRANIAKVAGFDLVRVRPATRLREVFSGATGQPRWREFCAAARLNFLPQSLFGGACLLKPATVRDLLAHWIPWHLAEFKHPGAPWTRAEVRWGVRTVIADILGRRDFSDDDQFVRDLRLG